MKQVQIITTTHVYEQWLNDPKITILKEFVYYNSITDEFTAIIVYTKDK